MSFFKNIGTESVTLCKKLAEFNDLKLDKTLPTGSVWALSDTGEWAWSRVVGNAVYILNNKSARAIICYLLDAKRINIEDFINYVYRPKPSYNPDVVRDNIKYRLKEVAKIYNSETKTLYCYGGPKGGMTDKHAEHIFNNATELLKYLNIKYIRKGSFKQHNIRIILI